MLTSPVNVTIATTNGTPFKPHATPSDAGTRKEPPLAGKNQPQPAGVAIEPVLRANSPLTHVDAVAATAGNRTILQELTLNIAAMLKLARRPDETLTALFARIVATIEAMPQAERLQFEVRSGLKGQKITLADLAAALRKPNGPEAARLTAIAEAPSAVPGRAAVSAATTTYLQEGTADGHAEEALAMRAAARSSAAGQNVFIANSRLRPADSQPTDAKVLQAQLKSMFEPGESQRTVATERGMASDRPATEPGSAASSDRPVAQTGDTAQDKSAAQGEDATPDRPATWVRDAAPDRLAARSEGTVSDKSAAQAGGMESGKPAVRGEDAAPHRFSAQAEDTVPDQPAARASVAVAERAAAHEIAARTGPDNRPAAERGLSAQPDVTSGKVVLSSASLKLDPPLVEKIRTVAQAIAGRTSEVSGAEAEKPETAKADIADRRLQPMLTLKGLVEIVTTLPAKAAEILTGMPAAAPVPLPEDASGNPSLLLPAATGDEPETAISSGHAETARETAPDMVPDHAADVVATPDMSAEHADSRLAAGAGRPETRAAAEDGARFANPEGAVPLRPDLVQHGVPFAYAQLQPAREDMAEAVSEEEAKDEAEDEGQDEDGEGGEKRRPRDEYDAIHDPLPEDDPGIVINRDSSEADRAFALYQRMGGF